MFFVFFWSVNSNNLASWLTSAGWMLHSDGQWTLIVVHDSLLSDCPSMILPLTWWNHHLYRKKSRIIATVQEFVLISSLSFVFLNFHFHSHITPKIKHFCHYWQSGTRILNKKTIRSSKLFIIFFNQTFANFYLYYLDKDKLCCVLCVDTIFLHGLLDHMSYSVRGRQQQCLVWNIWLQRFSINLQCSTCNEKNTCMLYVHNRKSMLVLSWVIKLEVLEIFRLCLYIKSAGTM